MEAFDLLGEALALLRRIRGLSQAELAAKSKLTPTQVSHYESNRTTPKLPQLARYLAGLGATLSDLVLALDAIRTPERYVHVARRGEEIAEGGELVLLLREGGMLVPVALNHLKGGMMAQIMNFYDIVREVTLGRAILRSREADAVTQPPRKPSPTSCRRKASGGRLEGLDSAGKSEKRS